MWTEFRKKNPLWESNIQTTPGNLFDKMVLCVLRGNSWIQSVNGQRKFDALMSCEVILAMTKSFEANMATGSSLSAPTHHGFSIERTN